ncbi:MULTISPECIES: BON domain-containing protein [Legionella]|uniref:BON domain-containing protein n=1 Tax=Legionella septentrionalis TaxID=2498109 RepID=A0A433JHB4_9GAMM|nr:MULTISPECIES: BON domain-containing protein [Legionella]MCP0913024.1 BON domain-containing protein [Legionella sp. 27cVA30]RUQ81684.1 BON domain-containing protein [Legionella septentrionalis]RUQ98511.1 BON domain-containing protein [Legionella septentrionalis]RUR10898.1 BON domain-containing protein [Legionella septentrionalis]RUR15338.1 BON domain-containing protein [Legionella septentrionalis]
MLRTFKFLMLPVFALIIIACAATPTQESTGEYLDSSAVTAKVKTELLDKLGAKGFEIKVKTYKDEVQLSGFVDNDTLKQQAGAIAADVDGVKSVRNDLIVK